MVVAGQRGVCGKAVYDVRADSRQRHPGQLAAAEGLLDELHLLVFPVVLGHGKRLFADPGEKVPLKLADSAAFETGVLSLTYIRA